MTSAARRINVRLSKRVECTIATLSTELKEDLGAGRHVESFDRTKML